MKPLREKRTVFTESVIAHRDEHDRPVYKVTLAERDTSNDSRLQRLLYGEGSINVLDRVFGRDFSIGMSGGFLLGSAASLALTVAAVGTGGALLTALPAMAALAGAVIGGTSDYVRNTKELTEGVHIGPATTFNRDTVRRALGFGALARLAVTVGSFALGAVGVSVSAPAAGVVGLLAASLAMPVGALKGSQEGYQRMAAEYIKAGRKEKHPEAAISVERQRLQESDLTLATGAALSAAVGLARSAPPQEPTRDAANTIETPSPPPESQERESWAQRVGGSQKIQSTQDWRTTVEDQRSAAQTLQGQSSYASH